MAVATDATRSPDHGRGADDGRQETQLERQDRNTIELVQEMRVAAVGIQVLLAFLLVVPFQAGWREVTPFDRDEYFITLVSIAIAAALLIAPSIHHRILFREHEKAYVVAVGNTLVIFAAGFMMVGFTGIFVLLTHVLFGGVAATIAGAATALATSAVWFGLPLNRRGKSRSASPRHHG
jgi:O-antigen/teichoic acid export membrane protein